MDLLNRIVDSINGMANVLPSIRKGYLGAEESFVIYPIPGSRTTAEYFDGEKDVSLNYEIAMKSKDGNKITDTLWAIQTALEDLESLNSLDQSFQFDSLQITNKPYINQIDDRGWLVFLLDISVNVSIKPN